MLSDRSFSLACRRIREHIANIVPAIRHRKPQPIPIIVLRTVDLRHTLSFVGSLVPINTKINRYKNNIKTNKKDR